MPYNNESDAAWAALMNAMTQDGGDRNEYLGSIYPKKQGTNKPLVYGKPARGGHSSSRASVPADSTALYHNHPPGQDNQYFPPGDINTADRLDWNSYIAIQNKDQSPVTADIRRYTPGQTSKTNRNGTRRGTERVSEGDPVLAKFPWQEYERYLRSNILRNRRQ